MSSLENGCPMPARMLVQTNCCSALALAWLQVLRMHTWPMVTAAMLPTR
jgi:hypothetical protein